MIDTSGPGPGFFSPCGGSEGPAEFDAGPWRIGPSGPSGPNPEDEDGDQ